jgi:glycosyltransferase involved in cell wall biosynthesis/SAM-dependent methyltransferase
MKPKISLAMIVRNTEATLDKCLSSAKDAVDEIVIVDTGSTDRTVEIAKKYTNNVYFFKWINDFSAARNYSFSLCTGTWIMWLDGDDYLLPADVKKINELDYSDKEIIISNYIYAHDEYGNSASTVPRERILKRSLNPVWNEPIHEYLALNSSIYISDIEVHHNKQHGTSERNLEILEKIVQTNPTPRNIYYLGKEYQEFNKIDEAIEYLERFVKMTDAFWEDVFQAHYRLASCYMGKNDEAKFKENIFKAISMEERWAEPYNLLGLYYMSKNQWGKAIQWYETALNVQRPKELLSCYQPEYYTWLPCLNLCVCYNNLGNMQKAYEYNRRVLEYRPTDSRALNNEEILSRALGITAPPPKKESIIPAPVEKKDGEGKKLNLGAGNKPMPGYVNVDIFKGPIIDEVFYFDNIPYIDNSIGAIHSEHALEHVPFKRAEKALKEWFRVLKPGGELLLKIPDFDDCCRKYVETPIENKYGRWWYKATIYGIQESQAGEPDNAQIHMCGFAPNEIQEVLERNGFIVSEVKKYDGFRTPSVSVHAYKPDPKKDEQKKSLKVGWICPENWEAAQTRIRVLNVDKWLKGHGIDSRITNFQNIVNEDFDVAIVGKNFSEAELNNIRTLKEKGKTVYADVCESLFEFPYFKEIIEICDKVICCSPYLAEQCQPVNDNVLVIEDAWES